MNNRHITKMAKAVKQKIDENPGISEKEIEAVLNGYQAAKSKNEVFCQVIREGDFESVKKRVKEGLDINDYNDNGNTPVLVAVWNGHLDIAKYLIENEADIFKPDQAGDHVFEMFASRHSHVLTYFIENYHFFNVNRSSKDGFTPLMQAINIPIFPKYGYKFGSGEMINLISDRLKCIHLLLENGADVNAVNKFGRTAIMGAAYTGCTEFVKVLLRYNADVTITCKKGKTVFDYAKSRDVQKILI